ncbi:MAG: Ig-like domain repeat protein, partial [Lachnospiraceae bacterium]|nr:Ig-like domain repeat protein [Lachnospiraceae bacterium]
GRDLAGNPSQGTVYDGVSPEAFVIDTAPPQASVAYDNDDAENGMYFRDDRTCLITVEDPNFDGTHGIVIETEHTAPAVAFTDGTAEVTFTEDGRYRLSGTVTDLAGNTASLPEEAAFVVDKTFPRLTIQGVDDLSSNRTPLELILSAEDRNLVKEGIAAVLTGILSGETGPGGEAVLMEEGLIWALDPIETDDQYRLAVTVTDLAGNSVSRTISFSENRGGTRIEWEQKEAEGQVIGHAMRPSFVIRDIDPVTVLSVSVNGQEVPYEYRGDVLTLREELSADGKYAIRIETVDAAGNVCVLGPVEFKIRHPEEAGEEEAAQKERPETVRPDTVSPETVSPEEADPEDGPSAADSPQEPPAAAHAPDQGAAPGNAGSGEEGPGEAAPEDLQAENAPADKTQTEPAEREENSSFAIPCAAGIFFILLILWKRRKERNEEQVTDRARR